MAHEIPRLARAWLISMLAVLFGVLGWLAITRRDIVGLVVVAIAVPIVARSGLSILSTQLSMDGVSQRRWLRRIFLRWSDVHSVEFLGRGTVALEGPPGRIRIQTYFYSDYEATVAWLAERLPHVWPRDA